MVAEFLLLLLVMLLDVPFFLVSISSDDSKATIRHLKDWEACQGDHQKVCVSSKYVRRCFPFVYTLIYLSSCSYFSVSMTRVTFLVTLAGHFGIILHLFAQNGTSRLFGSSATERAAVSLT